VEVETVTDSAEPRPVPGPPERLPGPVVPRPQHAGASADPTAPAPAGEGSPFAGLAGRPVAEHVAVYEAEHERLQRELSTIDQL
jgi:hypothetical protein